MKILFTGASSFTGVWFVRALARAGHEVTTAFPRAKEQYDELRGRRVEIAPECSRSVFGCRFGDDRFLKTISEADGWDLLCHHAADVTNYKSPDFDVTAATRNNTLNIDAVLQALGERGSRRLLLTGSVFEGGAGAGSDGLPSFSPYGLSKKLTAEVFAYYAARHGCALGKFIIPNPFGPLEEPRFTSYLARTWLSGKTAGVNTPDYVRDNIHVSLLAAAYVEFAASLGESPEFVTFSPSGYVESQGRFAERFAREMQPRLGVPCELDLAEQTDFSEPRVRINTDPVAGTVADWDESRAWDELAAYYREALGD